MRKNGILTKYNRQSGRVFSGEVFVLLTKPTYFIIVCYNIVRMRYKYFAILFLLFALTLTVSAQDVDHVPGDVLVMLQPKVPIADLIKEEQLYAGDSTKLHAVHCASPRMNIWLLHFDYLNIDEGHFLSTLQNNRLVKIAEFNHLVTSRAKPNDSLYILQWNLNNIGQTGGTVGDDIDAERAWNITTGGVTMDNDTIVIGVVDCGFDLNHVDIDYWKDHHGTPHYPGDYNGWNDTDSSGAIDENNCSPDGHGTDVTGIAGARGNNDIGICGVNWNVKMMPVEGFNSEANIVEGYTYIMVQRERYDSGLGNGFVVATNSSFGTSAEPSQYPLWCAMYDSLGSVGILSAAATADNHEDVDSVGDVPTGCSSDYLITVTNTDANDKLVYDAGYGKKTIDIGAPGEGVYSTMPGNVYDNSLSGTSQSSPHIAGAVALMYSLKCERFDSAFKANPSATALLIKGFILNSVDTVSTLLNKTVSNGRLNIYKALKLEAEYFGCDSLLGINKIEPSFTAFRVYPNPTSDLLNVKLTNSNNSSITIALTNILGERVLTQTYQPTFTGVQNITLNLNQLPDGLYFISAINREGVSNTLKVEKM